MKKILVDGLSVFMKHYSSNPSMSKNGYQIGGIVGFLKSIKELISNFKTKEITIIWEPDGFLQHYDNDLLHKSTKKNNFNRFYEKDEIPDTKENMNYQIIQLIKILKCLPIKQIFIKNSNGNNSIAFLSKNFIINEPNASIIIVSTNKNYHQLISNKITQWSFSKKKNISVENVIEEFGVHPNNFALFKAIVGDKSKNVKGVHTIGVGKIKKYFEFLSSNENYSLIDCLEKLKSLNEKIYKKLIIEREKIAKNIKLFSLDFELINYNSEVQINWSYNNPETVGNKNKIGFYKILNIEGINTFDVENLFMIINQIGKK